MTQFSIYEGYIPLLEKKLAPIAKKCEKYGITFTYNQVGEEFGEVRLDPEDKNSPTVNARYVIVEVDGTAILNDWEFVATLEHHKEGNIIRKALTDIELPERFKTAPCTCEHCNKIRNRKDTYVIHNTVTGEFKQVARTCIKDYTRGLSAEIVASILSYRGIFETIESYAFSNEPNYGYFLEVDKVLSATIEIIRACGYTKAYDEFGNRNPDSTRELTSDYLVYLRDGKCYYKDITKKIENLIEKFNLNVESEEVKTKVQAVKAWIKEQEDNSEYIHNLKIATSEAYIRARNFGILVSLIPTYEREQRKAEAKAKVAEAGKWSSWIGREGDKVEVNVTVQGIFGCETVYGHLYIYNFKDDSNNVIVWKTSTSLDVHSGDSIVLKGTIKELSVYKGTKQTVLTRCKIA